jgi:exopolyphosphatase/guanosine-5'-triphosphate,3'-diphosphate pyrophosphatase
VELRRPAQGAQISHSEYHKHGAYVLDHADAPGFATNELHLLSQLVLGHRGKLRKLETALDDEGFVTQVLALRLAVILCHARRDPDPLALNVARNGRAFVLRCRSRWIDAYPQSAHLLREETLAWQKTGWRVEFEVS